MSDTQVALTDRQRAFVQKFLLKRKSGPFQGKKNQQIDATNAATVQAFQQYDALERQFVAETQGVAGDWMAGLNATLATAMSDKEAGNFDAASGTMRGLIDSARNLKADIARRRQAALLTATGFTPPDWAPPPADATMTGLAVAASKALAPALPSKAALEGAEDSLRQLATLRAGTERAVRDRRAKLATALVIPPFVGASALPALQAARDAATNALKAELPKPADFTTADSKAAEFARLLDAEQQRVDKTAKELRQRLSGFDDGSTAAEPYKTQIATLRGTAATALGADGTLPTPQQFATAGAAIAKLERVAKIAPAMASLTAAGKPKSAETLGKVMKIFNDNLGDVDATEATLADARKATKSKKDAADQLLAEWHNANKMPQDTEEHKQARQAEIDRTGDAWVAANDDWKAALKREQMIAGQISLTEMVTGGPLSPDSKRGFDDMTSARFIVGFGAEPALAEKALRSAMTADYPKAIADKLPDMIKRTRDGFKADDGQAMDDPTQAQNYAANLLAMTGHVGPDFLDGFDQYIKDGKHLADKPLGAIPPSYSELCQKRSLQVAGALLKPDGSVDADSDAAKTAVGHVMFHPDSLLNPTPELDKKMLATLATIRGNPGAVKTALAGCKAPTAPVAEDMVRRALGDQKPPTEALNDADARKAVLASALKPTYQGPIGSCFATGPIRRLGETDLTTELGYLGQIATKGTLKLPGSLETPVVTKFPPNEDPLKRSLEYTTATAAARRDKSNERNRLKGGLDDGIAELVKSGDVHDLAVRGQKGPAAAMTLKLKEADLKRIASKFTFIYDPLVKTEPAADGSSSQGRFVLCRLPGNEAITTRDKFAEAVGELVIEALGVTEDSDKAKVRAAVKSDSFLKKVSPDATPDNQKPYKPWELASGGDPVAACQMIYGASAKQEDMLAAVPTATAVDEAERTKAVLKALLGKLRGSGEEMVTIRTVGMHTFNALPHDPSFTALTKDGKFDENIQDQLVAPGKAIADAPMPRDRAVWMFDEQIRAVLETETDAAKQTKIKDAAKRNRPTAAMKPQQVADAIAAALDAYQDDEAGKAADDWAAKQTSAPTPLAKSGKKDEYKKQSKEHAANEAKSLMMKELGVPRVMIADTNWGSDKDHTFFVMAPDPESGKLTMWEVTDPPGSFSPAGDKWANAQWAMVQ